MISFNDAYHSLRAQGINVSKKRKDIVDRFLTNKRYFDTNLHLLLLLVMKLKCLIHKQSYEANKSRTTSKCR